MATRSEIYFLRFLCPLVASPHEYGLLPPDWEDVRGSVLLDRPGRRGTGGRPRCALPDDGLPVSVSDSAKSIRICGYSAANLPSKGTTHSRPCDRAALIRSRPRGAP